MHQAAEELSGRNETLAARYTAAAADRLDDIAHRPSDQSLDDLVGTVSDFARRQPTLFLGGAIALGVLAGRFLSSYAPSGRAGGEEGADWRAGDMGQPGEQGTDQWRQPGSPSAYWAGSEGAYTETERAPGEPVTPATAAPGTAPMPGTTPGAGTAAPATLRPESSGAASAAGGRATPETGASGPGVGGAGTPGAESKGAQAKGT